MNPLFIHLGWLPEGVEFTKKEQAAIAEARASKAVRYDLVFPVKTAALERAFATFEKQGASERRSEFENWCAAQADWLCTLVNTGDGPVHMNKTLVIIPTKTKGVTIGPKIDKLGMRASDTCPVFFDNVRVPQRHRIGEEGMGFMMQMVQFQEERLCGSIGTLRGMESLIDQTIAYCKERHTFGQPLIDNQVIHFRMAELKTEVECLRSLIYRSVEDYIGGTDVTMLASMAKLKAGRLAREVSDACLQYWGGMGFTWDNPAARAYRDTRLLSIGGGADEIMLGIICKLMNILPGKKKKPQP